MELFTIMRLLAKDIEIRIPFACERCGKCCRELGIRPTEPEIDHIADFFKINRGAFRDRYFGKFVRISSEANGGRGAIYDYEKEWHPCPFQAPSNLCSFYNDRPGWCRATPNEREYGDFGIGCPGLKRMREAIKKVGRGRSYILIDQRETRPGGRKPTAKEWPGIWRKFRRAEPTAEMIEAFDRINEIEASRE
jgi:Fe-S-cluster containining protein